MSAWPHGGWRMGMAGTCAQCRALDASVHDHTFLSSSTPPSPSPSFPQPGYVPLWKGKPHILHTPVCSTFSGSLVSPPLPIPAPDQETACLENCTKRFVESTQFIMQRAQHKAGGGQGGDMFQ